MSLLSSSSYLLPFFLKVCFVTKIIVILISLQVVKTGIWSQQRYRKFYLFHSNSFFPYLPLLLSHALTSCLPRFLIFFLFVSFLSHSNTFSLSLSIHYLLTFTVSTLTLFLFPPLFLYIFISHTLISYFFVTLLLYLNSLLLNSFYRYKPFPFLCYFLSFPLSLSFFLLKYPFSLNLCVR